MEKQIVNLTIFLMKDTVSSIRDCLKSPDQLVSSKIRSEYGLTGAIFYCESNKKVPRWKQYLDEYSVDRIDISENASNKAVIIVQIKGRFMAVVFGYGRSFLREECIVRNFGFKVALNTINPKKMRSINAATIEDMVVNTQRQASYNASQEEFGLNITNDIMKGITGEPQDEQYGNHISGKDSLIVSVFMTFMELKTKLELYLEAYAANRYKANGFEWVDNVSEVRDSILSESLDYELSSALNRHNIDHLQIAPPETIDWDRVVGFCFSGTGKSCEKTENYRFNLDVAEYVEAIKPGINVFDKMKRDKLYGLTIDDIPFVICNVYNALSFQTSFEGKNYILSSGTWYEIDKAFLDQVNNYIQSMTISDISLPDCGANMDEEAYNKQAVNSNSDYCLLDKKMVSVAGGPRKIEACDIFTKNKQFIHVKNKNKSSQMSHLFAQGRVSAECFVSDEMFRKQIASSIKKKFKRAVFDYKKRPQSNEYEIIYVIIDKKEAELVDLLPFFSKVNLMVTSQELDRMHFRCSIKVIRRLTA